VVVAPSYFARRRAPRAPDDLVRHSCVQYRQRADGDLYVWLFERSRKSLRISVDGRVMVNTPDLAVRAAVDGLGIATQSKLTRNRSCARDSWSVCWKIGRQRPRDCSSVILGAVRSPPRCAPSST
jgi:DNA-binding transcriptional LysR family regulator